MADAILNALQMLAHLIHMRVTWGRFFIALILEMRNFATVG